MRKPPCSTVSYCYRLLERQKLDNGNKWPETIAVVLWGTDNIKTYGESLAQVSSHTVAVLIVKCVTITACDSDHIRQTLTKTLLNRSTLQACPTLLTHRAGAVHGGDQASPRCSRQSEQA